MRYLLGVVLLLVAMGVPAANAEWPPSANELALERRARIRGMLKVARQEFEQREGLMSTVGARSHFRGHDIRWTGEKWVYTDDGSDLPATGGEWRGCGHCNEPIDRGEKEHDPCLGWLPGVANACCGHGDREEAYVQFTNGVRLTGFTVDCPDPSNETDTSP